ncbi:hypothetical protein [Amorphus orientalis]|uniref:DUF4198 domain-containing protein n=1 Tax=Amorphus orientalis TaxID=649198 RepID=A0AAE4AUG0_9HYPH|nr:hypothetical protein [Amorphus orientalis]MDQ0315809.1 hypothetical protein [Amorphus orientalis]
MKPKAIGRLAGVAALLVALCPLAIAADVPVPKAKPDPNAPERAIPDFSTVSNFPILNSPEFSAALSQYAPPADIETGTPSEKEIALYLIAKLTNEGRPLDNGVHWRLFGVIPDADGRLPLITEREGGDAEFRLQPGRYLVHASFGRATAAKRIDLFRDVQTETFVLNAGGLKLSAVIGDDNQPPKEPLSFSIYEPDEAFPDGRRLVAEASADEIVPLPVGTYHVVSHYGGVNAMRRADLEVKPGKVIEATMQHRAASVTLKLVGEEGGEALADTAWTVYTPGGDIVVESVGAFPSFVLAAGDYSVVAKNRDQIYSRNFTVDPGADREVEVLARTEG